MPLAIHLRMNFLSVDQVDIHVIIALMIFGVSTVFRNSAQGV
jgi:riboflavin transporter FmnP